MLYAADCYLPVAVKGLYSAHMHYALKTISGIGMFVVHLIEPPSTYFHGIPATLHACHWQHDVCVVC